MGVDWCEELRNLEFIEPNLPALLNGMVEGIRKLQPDPIEQMIKQGVVLLCYEGMGGKPRDLATLAQATLAQRGKRSRPRKPGVCRDLKMGKCNPLSNGGGCCRKNTRLTIFCPLRIYFARRYGGTLSTKLSLEGLQLVREYKLRQLNV